MSDQKNILTEWGVNTKIKLLKKGMRQNHLIEEIKIKHPDVYIDTGLLDKLLKGQIKKSRLYAIIDDILETC